MRPKKLFIILSLISLVLLPLTPALAAEVTADDIAAELMCMCGCGLVLAACHCEEPDGAVEMKAVISEQLAQGESQQEILGYFVAQYGGQILAPPTPTTTPPPKQDPNLVLWVLALIGILAGGVIIYQRQNKRGRRKRR